MKKIIQLSIIPLLVALILCPILCSNSNPKKKITKVAYKYTDAMANYRIDDAMQYCTQETIDGAIAQSRRMVESVQPGFIESDTPAKVKILSVEITSDTTAIAHFNKVTPIRETNGQVDLVYRDGKWLVHVILPSPQKTVGTTTTPKMPKTNDTTINGRTIIGFPSKPQN